MEKKNNIDPQYNNLLKDILENGIKKQTRNGEVLSVFGKQIRHKMSDGFPLLTCKKIYFKGIVTELLWFLRGDTNIKYLINNDCHIWDGDVYKNYSKQIISNNLHLLPASDLPKTQEEFINKIKTDNEFANKWGNLGPIYGKQWRNWESIKPTGNNKNEDPSDGPCYWTGYDQIQNLIHKLKTNPDDRRMMVSAWNVGEIDQMVLPPCHYGFQVWTRELSHKERELIWLETQEQYIIDDYENGIGAKKELLDLRNIPTRAISLMWNQRSVDTFLGLPFNIASYGLLLEILAKKCNMVADELIGNLGDTHIYLNHIEQAKEQINREPYPLSKLDIHPGILDYNFDKLEINMFKIENYQPHPTIKAPLSN